MTGIPIWDGTDSEILEAVTQFLVEIHAEWVKTHQKTNNTVYRDCAEGIQYLLSKLLERE